MQFRKDLAALSWFHEQCKPPAEIGQRLQCICLCMWWPAATFRTAIEYPGCEAAFLREVSACLMTVCTRRIKRSERLHGAQKLSICTLEDAAAAVPVWNLSRSPGLGIEFAPGSPSNLLPWCSCGTGGCSKSCEVAVSWRVQATSHRAHVNRPTSTSISFDLACKARKKQLTSQPSNKQLTQGSEALLLGWFRCRLCTQLSCCLGFRKKGNAVRARAA